MNRTELDNQAFELSGGVAINEWIEAHQANFVMVERESRVMHSIDSVLVEPPGERTNFGVQHFLYDSAGLPLFLFARVYEAVDAEHALHQYLFAEMPERRYGRGKDHVFVKLYDSNFSYEEQEVRVFPLWEGTDQFV